MEGIIQQYSLSLWPVIVNCSINAQLLLNSVFFADTILLQLF